MMQCAGKASRHSRAEKSLRGRERNDVPLPSKNIGHEVAANKGEGQEHWVGPVKKPKEDCDKQRREMPVAEEEDDSVVEERLHGELLKEAPSEIASEAAERKPVHSRDVKSAEKCAGNDLSNKEEKRGQDGGSGCGPDGLMRQAKGRR
jgi:hypothetical protein